MKLLGIDYGVKRVGVARTDENGTLAFPLVVLANTHELFQKLEEIIKKENIEEVVVGESRDADDAENKINTAIDEFILELEKKFNLRVHREKEFFSSFEAHSRMGKEANSDRKNKFPKTEDVDSKAAAIILQRYLDRKNNPST